MNAGNKRSKAECTRRAILRLLSRGRALTADALAERLGLSILYVRPRVSELVSKGRVVASGEHAPNASGKLANKWTAA